MGTLPEVGSNWFDHDRGRVWRIHMIAGGDYGVPEITSSYVNGEEMGFELLSEWSARLSTGRYELITAPSQPSTSSYK